MKPKITSKPQRPTCRCAKYLRQMPPLQHKPAWCRKFLISNSEVVRFIIRILGGNPANRPIWSEATRIFNEASKAKVLIYDRENGTWQGCEYRQGSESPEIQKWIRQMRRRFSSKS